ncbi:MAG: efflux RND transporter periplasmic adaptor subunit [Anaerolineae bacterium]|nr:efflux RND transporter periplasmic adaptor subunit [Anaerolineae bacterium]
MQSIQVYARFTLACLLLAGLVSCSPADEDAIGASGIVEVTQVAISSELGGIVKEVLVDEGQQVKLGQIIVRFDASILELQLNLAQTALTMAQASYDQAAAASELEIIAAQQALDDLQVNHDLALAQAELGVANARAAVREAQRRLDNLPASANEIDTAVVEAELALAEASLDAAERALEDLQDGPDPDLLALAEARLKTAEAALPLAEAQVASAQASLDLIQAQLDKTELKAPMDGIVLFRMVEPGEVAIPGAPLLMLASLDDLNITVYIAEDKYGRINLGDSVNVTADSFADEVFAALVTHIADQAEYTPRNVQTEEDRRTTVFAIQLSVDDPSGKLKPGMPVDVIFP